MPRNVDQDEQRGRIARAAWTVIGEVGLERASLRQIAHHAGCTTGLLTHLFADRDALIAHALAEQDRVLGELLEQCVTEATDGRDAMARNLFVQCAAFDGHEHDGVLLRRLAAALADARVGAGLRGFYDRVEAGLTALVVAAQADGSFAARRDAPELAEHLMTFADGLYIAGVVRPDRYPNTRRRALIDREIALLEETLP